jgi:uncharacterized protein
MLTAEQIIEKLQLKPLPKEGGYYSETYRSSHMIPASSLPKGYSGYRCVNTAIFYLLTPDKFSALHMLPGDEIFHFYLGDPVEMLQLHPDGTGNIVILGSDLLAGMSPQVVVPGEVWQGSRLMAGGSFALMGTTVAPGFEFADYNETQGDELITRFPQFTDHIKSLIKGP